MSDRRHASVMGKNLKDVPETYPHSSRALAVHDCRKYLRLWLPEPGWGKERRTTAHAARARCVAARRAIFADRAPHKNQVADS
jgi:hypothetical protein